MVRTSKVENANFIRFDSYLNWFTFIVTAVIKTFYDSLFQSLIRVIKFNNRTLSILLLMDFLLDYVRFKIIHRIIETVLIIPS